jgi:type IV fimbrial biogenesis protein FimT
MDTMRGWTLIELLVATAIAAVLLSLSISAYSSARGAVVANDAQAALQLALREAIRASALDRQHVVVCSSADGEACSGSIAWEHGWIAFIDRDRNRAPDPGARLLHRQQAFERELRVRSTAGRTRVVVQPHGGAANGSNATFTICDVRGAAHARTVVLAGSGRVRSGKPGKKATIACP